MIKLPTKKLLLHLHNHDEKELYYVVEEDKYYKWVKNQWEETKLAQASISLYDINKQAKKDLPDLNDTDLDLGEKNILDFATKNPSQYYMLLNNEMKYYTVFETGCEDGDATFVQEVMNLLKYFDNVKSIELVNDDTAVEIWATLNGELGAFYLFDYNKGVIRCRR